MRIVDKALDGVLLLEARVFSDARGHFFESFNQQVWRTLTGLSDAFVQDNHSRSVLNVIRGLHYQITQPQGKIVRCSLGRIYDVCVDIRRSSPSFGRWVGWELSEENHRLMWVPPGFAHGFLTLSDQADCLYKTTDYWSPSAERTILWNDPDLAIDWPLSGAPILSDKDKEGIPFRQAEVF